MNSRRAKYAEELKRRKVLREKLLLRSGGKCEHCHLEPDWRGLQMAHVDPLGMGGGHGKTDEDNCLMLCAICHDFLLHGIIEKDGQGRPLYPRP